MRWKNTGLFAIILAALAIVTYAQTSNPQRAHSANLQITMSAGYLGVGFQDLNPERLKALSMKEASGVEITSVTEDAPAAKAGIRVRDVILEVSGQKIANGQDLVESIGSKSPGTKITLTIWRDGAKQNLAATLGRQLLPQLPLASMMPISPEDLQALFAGDAWKLGFEGEPLTPQLAAFFGAAQGEGVLVRTVLEKSPADKAGLKAGDVVIKVNGMPVSRSGEIIGIVRTSKKAIFTVIRNKKEITLNVEIARNNNPFEPEADN
jgi:serine protease Do